jgi:DNA-binding LytR/AlgR family response regulator
MSISCIIIEDQEPAQRLIKSYINDVDDLILEQCFSNAISALDYMKSHSVDLILLDIHLPKLSGMDFLEILNPKPIVVLTTAFADYALKSYDFEVTDYLLKPFSFERFMKAIVRVRKQLDLNSPENNEQDFSQSILVKVGYEHVKISFSEILYIKSDGDYTQVFTNNEKFLVSHTLRFWVENLPFDSFKQVHRSHVVNLKKVEKVRGSMLIVNGYDIPIGRVFKKELVESLSI